MIRWERYCARKNPGDGPGGGPGETFRTTEYLVWPNKRGDGQVLILAKHTHLSLLREKL